MLHLSRQLSRIFLLAVAGVCLTLLACSGSEPESAATATIEAEPSPTPTPAATATPVPPTPTPRVPNNAVPFPEPMRESANRLLDEVAAAWGRPPKGQADMFLLSRQSATDYYTPVRDENAPRRPDVRGDLYRLLGLVPERTDVGAQDVAYLGSLITGFYASDLNAFFLLDDQGPVEAPKAKSTVVHEFTHVLQDQYHDLDAIGDQRAQDWDATRAFLSLLEGDALTIEKHFFGRPLRVIPTCFTMPAASSTSYAIARDLDTWYFDGYCFVQAVMEQGMTPAQIWERLPANTEHILHPEKYLTNEPAQTVTLQPIGEALGPEWQREGGSVFGEYFLQNLLQPGLSRDLVRVQRAAAGWGGDRWVMYENGDQRLMQASILWDTPEDADEFFASLEASLRNRAGEAMASSQDRISATIDGRTWRAALVDGRVELIVASDADAAERVALALKL